MSRSIDLSLLPTLIAFTVFLFASACAKESASAPPPPPPPSVGITKIAPASIAQWDELPGRVEAIDEVELRPRVGGMITKIELVEGAIVHKGDVLFTIDARPYRAALQRAIATQAGARARLELAQLEAERSERLIASGAITKSARDATASAASQAAADLAAAAAAVSLAQLDMEYATVRAPITGRAGRALVDVGDMVAPGVVVLTTIVSRDPIYVSFTTDEATYLRFAPRLRAGETVPVAIGIANEDGYPHSGRVDFVANGLDPQTGTIAMRAVIDNKDDSLTPGLYARVRLSGGSGDAIVVDERAILTDQDRKYVLVVDDKSIAQRKDVGVGRVLDGKRVITRGLVAGDQVIVSGLSRVMPGAPVAIQPDAAAGAGAANGPATNDTAAHDSPTGTAAHDSATDSAASKGANDDAAANHDAAPKSEVNATAKSATATSATTTRDRVKPLPLDQRPTPMAKYVAPGAVDTIAKPKPTKGGHDAVPDAGVTP